MTPLDQITLALCAWKENRSGGSPGMQSCMNVILHRSVVRKLSVYAVCYQPEQFSSMSDPHDKELLLQCTEESSDLDQRMWVLAQELSSQAAANVLPDITGGALSYYAVSIKKVPYWAPSMTPTVIIAGQQFLK